MSETVFYPIPRDSHARIFQHTVNVEFHQYLVVNIAQNLVSIPVPLQTCSGDGIIFDDSFFDFRFQALTILPRLDNLTRIQWSENVMSVVVVVVVGMGGGGGGCFLRCPAYTATTFPQSFLPFPRFCRLHGRFRGGHGLISSQRHRAGIHSSVGI